MRVTARRVTGLATALVVVGTLAACSSDADDPAPTAPARASAPPTARTPSVPMRRAGTYTPVPDFGTDPGGLSMFEYVPAVLADPAPVVVAIHYCTGSAEAFRATGIETLADAHGFVVVYPQADRPGHCFDVASHETLTRDGGSDSQSIAQMVAYVQAEHVTDPGRVFAFGYSSGAMMTEVLLAAYPDVFAAGAAFAGVPAGCAATDDPPPGPQRAAAHSERCWRGTIDRTPQEWGDLVRAAYPGYTGPRPRVQLWHGTADAILRYPNLGEAIEQWTDVLGVPAEPVATDELDDGWTRTRYGSDGDRAPVEAYSLDGGVHDLGVHLDEMALFFGLDGTD